MAGMASPHRAGDGRPGFLTLERLHPFARGRPDAPEAVLLLQPLFSAGPAAAKPPNGPSTSTSCPSTSPDATSET